jgi:hypothetical protein
MKTKKPDIEIITHPMSSGRLNEESKLDDFSQDIDKDEDLDVTEIHNRVVDFIKQLLPNAFLIREFNGNFVY